MNRKIPVIIIIMICLLSPFSFFNMQSVEAAGENWWNSSWSYRKLITIDTAQVDTSLTYYPILIKIDSDTELDDGVLQADGGDIAFINHYDNSTQYDHEIEYFNSATGELKCWVEVEDMSHYKLWMYYGNSGCDNQWDITGTWDSDFVMVLHMDDATTSTTLDSTSNDNDGSKATANEPMETSSGKIHDAQDFEQNPTYLDHEISVSDSSELDGMTHATIEMWIRVESDTGQDQDLFMKSDEHGGSEPIVIWRDNYASGDRYSFLMTDTAGHYSGVQNLGATASVGAWQYLVFGLDGDTNMFAYVNGQEDSNSPFTPATKPSDISSVGNYPITLGIDRNQGFNKGKEFDGIMDEVRYSDIKRSSGYISTTYNTINSGDFYDLGSEEEESAGWTNSAPSFSEVSPVNESTAQGRGKTLSVKVTDADGNQSTCDFYTSLNGVDWTHRQTNTTVLNGTIQYVFSSATSFNTLYYWKITANDTHDNSTAIYEYTTRVEYLISSDGIQEYLNKPCGWHYHGTHNRTYFAYTDEDNGGVDGSDWIVSYFDHDLDEFSSEVTLGEIAGEDDHIAPTLVINSTGYIFVFMSGHSNNVMKVQRSTNPEDISHFQKAVDIDTTGTTTYPKPWVMENDTIGVSYRDTSTSPDHQDIAFSTDSGATWDVRQLTDSGSFAQIYCEEDNTDYLHFTVTDPVDTTGDREDIYYAYSDDGGYSWYNSADTEISWPLNYTDMTKCWDENQVRQLDLYAGSDHKAHILANADLGNSNATIPLYHIWYDGSSWNNESMPVWQSVFRHHDTHNYTNGGCFDRKNPNVVYTAGYDGENIDLAVYARSGGSWSKVRVDVNDAPPSGNTIIVRPMPIKYYYNMSYTYAKGTYSMYNSYSTTYYYGYEYSIDNNLPQLSSNSVYPTSGVASYTVFQFNITWTDADGEDPTDGYLKVNISKVGWNTNQSMSWVSGSNSTGAVYTYSTTLTAGEYSYTFYAYDGIDYNSSGAHSDPSVTAQDISFTIETSSETGDFEFINWTITSPGAGSTTEYNVSEDNQTDGTSACTIINTGNVPLNFSLMWLTDPGEGITLKYSLTNTAPNPGVNSIAVSPSETQIITDLATSSSQDVWLWIDFVSVSSQEDDADVRFTSEIYETG